MVTVTVKSAPEKPETLELPALYERVNAENGDELVVLFTCEHIGMVIESTSRLIYFGDFREDWSSCITDTEWKRLPDGTTVTLTQGQET